MHWFAETKARYNMGANRTRLNRVLAARVVCGRRERDPSTHVRVCLLACAEHGVTLLPQEFAGAKEGRGVLELPADNVGPLVQAQRQVTGHNNQQQHQQCRLQTRQHRETSVTTQLSIADSQAHSSKRVKGRRTHSASHQPHLCTTSIERKACTHSHTPVAVNPLRVRGVHDRLGRGADGHGLRKVRTTALGDPRHLPQAAPTPPI